MVFITTTLTVINAGNIAYKLYNGDVKGALPDIAIECLPFGLNYAGKALKHVNYAVQTAHYFGDAKIASTVLNGASKLIKAANYVHYTKGYADAVKNVARAGKMAYDYADTVKNFTRAETDDNRR